MKVSSGSAGSRSPRLCRTGGLAVASGAAAMQGCRDSIGGVAMAADDHRSHAHGSELSDLQLRVRALETILTEKGYVDPAALDQIVENAETKIGPHLGARIVAHAWADPEF